MVWSGLKVGNLQGEVVWSGLKVGNLQGEEVMVRAEGWQSTG